MGYWHILLHVENPTTRFLPFKIEDLTVVDSENYQLTISVVSDYSAHGSNKELPIIRLAPGGKHDFYIPMWDTENSPYKIYFNEKQLAEIPTL